jgi:Holliday junction DNA helicase RuvA
LNELGFFELLITVSGIGPKSAMSILSVASISHLKNAIISGDTTHLVKVSGVGKKNAEKIVLELKDKLSSSGEDFYSSGDVDVIEALKSLGYGERESRDALKKITGTHTTSEKIKKVLKLLS